MDNQVSGRSIFRHRGRQYTALTSAVRTAVDCSTRGSSSAWARVQLPAERKRTPHGLDQVLPLEWLDQEGNHTEHLGRLVQSARRSR